MKTFGLSNRWIKGVPLYKKSTFSHNSNKNTSIPLRSHFRKNPWFSTKVVGKSQNSFQIFNGFFFPFFMIFFEKWPKSTISKKSKCQNQFKNQRNLVSKVLLDSLPNIIFKVQIQISRPKKSIFQGKLTKKNGATLRGYSHDEDRHKFSECIKNDRKALELWGFGFWNFTCMKNHWRFPNYKLKIFSKYGISHSKEIGSV